MNLRLVFVFLLAASFSVAQDEGDEKSDAAGSPDLPATEEKAEPNPDMADRLPRPEDTASAPAPGAATGESADDLRSWDIDGYLTTRVVYENASDENVLRLFMDLNTDTHHRGKIPFTIRLNGRVAWTISDQPSPDDLLYGIWDTFDGSLQAVLYELFISFPEIINEKSRLILGRQFIEEGVYLQYDGGRFDLSLDHIAPDLVVSVYGGGGVEWGMPNDDDHWLVGVLGKGSIPAWKTRWRLQYLYVNQYFEGINDPAIGPLVDPVSHPSQTLNDHLVGATIWQPLGDQTRFFGRFTLLNGDANELHLRLRWFTKDNTWVVRAEWYQLFQRLFNVTNDLTPYVPMLGSFDPFFRASLKATWRPRPDLIVELGGVVRVLENSEDENTFNHEWFNYYVTFTWLDLMKDKLDLTITAAGYDTEGNTQNVITSNVDIRLKESLTLALGLDYALYKYIWFDNTEREDVWTYRAELEWKPKPALRGVLGLYIDDDSVTTWTYLVAKLTWKF
ncbi:MAG: hypothetical protein ACYTGZ_06980 [Planctomycetota bacterium]|jgi:hypothetical protein